MRSCASCRYWAAPQAANDAGECRRSPPQVLIQNTTHSRVVMSKNVREETGRQIATIPYWPPTDEGHGCGEWRALSLSDRLATALRRWQTTATST